MISNVVDNLSGILAISNKYFFSLIAVDKNWSASMKKILTILSRGSRFWGKDVLKKDKKYRGNVLEFFS